MNSDNYEFSKSSAPQSVSDYSSYTDKQWNYVNDTNSGVYTTSGQTLVQFDLSSIYNSNGFCDVSDTFLAIPIVMTAVCSTGSTILAAPLDGVQLCSLKSNYQNLIHSIEIIANGKCVNDMQPFVSMYKNFKLLSELSVNDLQSSAVSWGLSSTLDNEKSVVFTTANIQGPGQLGSAVPTAAGYPGIGLCNNLPYALNGAVPVGPSLGQNRGQSNKAIYDRTSRIIDVSQTALANSYQNIYGEGLASSATACGQVNLINTSALSSEFKANYTVSGTGQMVWNDVAIIPLKYLVDCIDKMGLVKKMDMVMRFYVNTGSIQIAVINAAVSATTLAYGPFTSTFGTTCPLTINWLSSATALVGVPAATTFITAGVFIGKAPASFGSTSIAITAVAHPMTACRTYYSTVQIEPSKAISYIEANIAKEIIYENFLFNQYSSIPKGGNFSQLVQSGIKNPIGICIIPLINASNQFAACTLAGTANVYPLTTLGFSQYQSPYDPCPATYSPLSLTNIQVQLGGVNVLSTPLNYTYENFLQQVSLAETLTSSDIGITAGLISQSWWEANRVYWVDLGRGQEADKATTRNLNISFTNNSTVIIDVMVFTVYLDRFVLNVLTGQVKR